MTTDLLIMGGATVFLWVVWWFVKTPEPEIKLDYNNGWDNDFSDGGDD